MIAQLAVGLLISVTGAAVVIGTLARAVRRLPAVTRWVRLQYRRLRFRAALLLNRPVPADGLPLDPDEARGFIDVVRGWGLPAREPARQGGGQS